MIKTFEQWWEEQTYIPKGSILWPTLQRVAEEAWTKGRAEGQEAILALHRDTCPAVREKK